LRVVTLREQCGGTCITCGTSRSSAVGSSSAEYEAIAVFVLAGDDAVVESTPPMVLLPLPDNGTSVAGVW
jgi:hypothetical protein